jgi:hypothetical protein
VCLCRLMRIWLCFAISVTGNSEGAVGFYAVNPLSVDTAWYKLRRHVSIQPQASARGIPASKTKSAAQLPTLRETSLV